MATNFSPCKGSYVLNQFPSNVMFGMNGFHVSASGAIQGHHGPLVSSCNRCKCTYSHLLVYIYKSVYELLFLHVTQLLYRAVFQYIGLCLLEHCGKWRKLNVNNISVF